MHYILFFIVSPLLHAAEGAHHHGSVSDLKFYFINFFIFVSVICWKVYPLIKNYFREQHLLMKNHFHTSSEKLRLAKIEKEKIDNDIAELDRKISDMKTSANRDLDVYRVRYKKELDEKITVLAKDLDYQVDFDTMALNNNMYNALLNKITDSVEKNVSANNAEKKIVTEALVNKSGLN